MKTLILLLFCITAISVVCAKIRFPLRALMPDLYAFEHYYYKGDKNLKANIQWPNSVNLRVRPILGFEKQLKYLKLDGNFEIVKCFFLSEKIEGLYYRRQRFYRKVTVRVKEEMKGWKEKAQLKLLSPETKVYYSEPLTEESQSYLSIRYFSLEEIQQRADVTYNAYKDHFDYVLKYNPAIFLATLPGSDGHFVEYAYTSEYNMPLGEDAKIWVLTGTGKGTSLKLTGNSIAFQLVYDPNKHTFYIPEDYSLFSKPTKNVIGVRMMNTAFLAEVHDSHKRLWRDNDVIFGLEMSADPDITKEDILEKSAMVEPRLKYRGIKDSYYPSVWPKDIKFQIKGITFTKSANLLEGTLNKYCPFLIKREDGKDVSFDNRSGSRICSDDFNLRIREAKQQTK